MGVYIRGLELPENCSDCKFKYMQEIGCPHKGISFQAPGRHPDCPFVEPIPHGDLIDINWLKENDCAVFKEIKSDYGNYEEKLMWDTIPVVIKEEE